MRAMTMIGMAVLLAGAAAPAGDKPADAKTTTTDAKAKKKAAPAKGSGTAAAEQKGTAPAPAPAAAPAAEPKAAAPAATAAEPKPAHAPEAKPAAAEARPAEAAPAAAPAPADELGSPALASPAPEEPPAPAAPKAAGPNAWATISIGGFVPQLFNKMGLSPQPRLAGGYFLPVLDKRIALGFALEYAQPGTEQTMTDPRVPGGKYTFKLVERDLRIGLGAQYHFLPASDRLSPYAGARLRIHLLDGVMTGGAEGNQFGEQHEKGTKVGGAPYAGLLFHLGPGVLTGELEVDIAPVDHLVTGDRNLSALSLLVGYGLLF